ncbi:MAG: enoyl-CoA hydratase/isomerase family protein [Pseudorhodoplanes sp.]|nr:enoyl-CoA hydratase/isomerase family protein [Pseudorhodoplanes sp.]
MEQAERPVLLTIERAVAIVTLNRPCVLNAIDVDMARAFRDAIDSIDANGRVRSILLRGEGRAFCAGGDVSAFSTDNPAAAAEAIIDYLHEALTTLADIPVPSIAAVQGAAAGAGFSLALACDLAIAADDAVFSLAFARIGASPDSSSTYWLPRLVGARKALELALLADPIDADEAMRIGLVNNVVPAATLQRSALALAERLSRGPTGAYGRTKALLRQSLSSSLVAQLDRERDAFLQSAQSIDFAEGVAAFLAKRSPRFEGSR